jgi:hypothetical protein
MRKIIQLLRYVFLCYVPNYRSLVLSVFDLAPVKVQPRKVPLVIQPHGEPAIWYPDGIVRIPLDLGRILEIAVAARRRLRKVL